jgi:DNA-binding NarL/FixJ family response regulator
MVVVIRASLLSVGLAGKDAALLKLPIRVISIRTGADAISSLKNQEVDGVLSNWELPDMPDGRFLRGIKAIKPYIPAVALIRPGDTVAEIAARSLGVSAVLTYGVSDQLLQETVCQILGLRTRSRTRIRMPLTPSKTKPV